MSPERISPVERLCQSAERQKEKEIRRSPLTKEKKENVMREKTIREAEACDSRGWTRMTRAAFTGNIGEMKKLLDGGCDVNSQDNMGMTPLHWARTTEMMSYLIDSGANPEIRDNCGMSVLTATVFYACDESITERVKLLLDAGADVDVEDGEGRSPLQLAVDRGLPEVAALLVHAGADPNARDVYGWTALHLAAGRGNKRVAEALMQAGADPSLRDDEGKTPADLAANALVRKAIMNGSCQA